MRQKVSGVCERQQFDDDEVPAQTDMQSDMQKVERIHFKSAANE